MCLAPNKCCVLLLLLTDLFKVLDDVADDDAVDELDALLLSRNDTPGPGEHESSVSIDTLFLLVALPLYGGVENL